jgi:hypothetical protein
LRSSAVKKLERAATAEAGRRFGARLRERSWLWDDFNLLSLYAPDSTDRIQ